MDYDDLRHGVDDLGGREVGYASTSNAGPPKAQALDHQSLYIPPLLGWEIIDGTWLDDCLVLRGAPGSELLKRVFTSIEALDDNEVKQSRRSDHRANFEKLMECIVANAVRARLFRENDAVAYNRRHGSYWNCPRWISGESLAHSVDLLCERRLLIDCKGEIGRSSSIYAMSPLLSNMMADCGVTIEHIGRTVPADESLIILRSGDDEKSEIRYEPTGDTRFWAEKLGEYNRFVEQRDIRLELSDEEKSYFIESAYERRSQSDRQPKMVEPEFFRRHLYRIFNDGVWEHGGRFYRAWWQNVPRTLRRNITIDGSRTAELDFSGFLPRSLYNLDKKPYPMDDDPYEIPELASYAGELGKAPDHFRKSNKKLLVALLNSDKSDGHPEKVKLNESYLPRYSRADVEALLAKKHPFLAEMFRSGVGKRNQRLDSDIAFEVMSNLLSKGILVLPIHDSFVVKAKHKEALLSEMIESYKSKLGFDPVIKEA